jgi:protein TonB
MRAMPGPLAVVSLLAALVGPVSAAGHPLDYDTPPKVLQRPKPDYPTDAMRAGAEGKVMLGFQVTSDGKVTDIEVIESAPMLDEAAIANVKEWRFEAARKNGQPVPAYVRGVVTFRLRGAPPDLGRADLGQADQAFLNTGRVKKKVPELIERLAHKNPDVRADAAWQLSGLPHADAEATAALVQALRDPAPAVRHRAALALFVVDAAAAEAALLRATDADVELTRQPSPSCSEKAIKEKLEGEVELDLLVSEQGQVLHAKQMRPKSVFDESTVIAASRWHFVPMKKDGNVVPFMTRATFEFHCGSPKK